MGIRVLSLFDGMSCCQIALKELGIKVDKYYASEIDKHAIKQTLINFPDTIQLGSVTEVDARKLGHIDLLAGGSPCTNFSFAGRRNGMNTTTNEEIYTLERYLELKEQGFEVCDAFHESDNLAVGILLRLQEGNLVVLLCELVDRACGRVLVATEQTAEAVATEQARGDCGSDSTDDAGGKTGSAYALGGVFLIFLIHHLIISFRLVCKNAYRVFPESAL